DETAGIWIGHPTQREWWRVPGSGSLAQGEGDAVLEQLRATRPVWTSDGRHFAFVSCTARATPQQTARHVLRVGDPSTRSVAVWSEGPDTFRDLHWTPDSTSLGLVRDGPSPTLHLIRQGGPLSQPLNHGPVRKFAGWDAQGQHLAYTVPEPP